MVTPHVVQNDPDQWTERLTKLFSIIIWIYALNFFLGSYNTNKQNLIQWRRKGLGTEYNSTVPSPENYVQKTSPIT